MSCNRYHLWAALDVHAFSKAEAVLRFSAEEDGMWVQWQDYARLKAENERLRKAGDALGSALILFEMKSEEERQERLEAWAAAKEGNGQP